MTIRLSRSDIAKAVALYQLGNVSLEQDVKIRIRCAVEAIFHFVKAFYHRVSIALNYKDQNHQGLGELAFKRTEIFAKSVFNPKEQLLAYEATIGLEAQLTADKAVQFVAKILG